MLNNINKAKLKFRYPGQIGLPEEYPIPQLDGLLFYIQRNLNRNTVVYVLNVDPCGFLNEDYPMTVYWIRYDNDGQIKNLNLIQNKLAYGYRSQKINNETFRFSMVSYDKKEFFIVKNEGQYKVVTEFQDQWIDLSNIYVYAEEFGIFPQVKYIEFFGEGLEDNFPKYNKILL